ncbi:hypothetical protein CEUSTIGMA_g6751.t1 [Chlamydomonas eustigma]|uniref:Uncharacterized protein n=1 Tax=Chlamydomonas eustigma TaxID=1157962 RepID=A0A250X966_9CHLO|nr:hypothetical protein CEUSTIGMA_g6751.t1 [Chlamydomonas eustigma]|eukprot:GAX79310.1 hypothetical protein CEUSTIGMA_g6751.t1 [Chlamydomonas eustigma]
MSSSQEEDFDDIDYDDIPLSLLDDHASSNGYNSYDRPNFTSLNVQQNYDPLPSSRGPKPILGKAFDLNFKKLPQTPEHGEEPMPSSRIHNASVFAKLSDVSKSHQDDACSSGRVHEGIPRMALPLTFPALEEPGRPYTSPLHQKGQELHQVESAPLTSLPPPTLNSVRSMKPPRLTLQSPASASPLNTPSAMVHAQPDPNSSSLPSNPSSAVSQSSMPSLSALPLNGISTDCTDGRVLVSLLSPAFSLPSTNTLNTPSGGGSAPTPASTPLVHTPVSLGAHTIHDPSTSRGDFSNLATPTGILSDHAVRQRVASSLGLPPSKLRCFVVQETPWEQLEEVLMSAATTSGAASSMPPPHVAVLVDNSSFNLPALEEMMKQSRQLLSAQEANAKTISALHHDFKEAAWASQKHAVRNAQLERDVEFSKEKLLRMESEAAELRSQLKRCDEQRLHFRNTLSGLRGEFERYKGMYEASTFESNAPQDRSTMLEAAPPALQNSRSSNMHLDMARSLETLTLESSDAGGTRH